MNFSLDDDILGTQLKIDLRRLPFQENMRRMGNFQRQILGVDFFNDKNRLLL